MQPDSYLQQNLVDLNHKMDALLKDKVDVQYYRDRHEELERRVDLLESDVRKINEIISNLHNSSMAFVNEALSNMEHRIFDKIEENSKFSRSHWIMIAVAAIGWIASFGGLLVAILRH